MKDLIKKNPLAVLDEGWEDETPYVIKDDDFEENFNAEWEEYKE
jgi:hypothetical protein